MKLVAAALMAIGTALVIGCVLRRAYLDLTGKWTSVETHVLTGFLVSIGGLTLITGILLTAAP
ncbi:MAG: hypothetical protein EOQ64_15545 [Mesorhizobium sp.]|uniref:hypothetical protein n=1 Tax=Mesorhizobium sp. TaxID=1871066 RepID=UPI000FE75D80|nr:hypothetical protein [Mesorhizobium sp.]RWG55877.1 MAG: hypothetical protein EOQ64_15545 [Mesorhizobium sp.]RWH44932.1 MAG: hypothetical protein EOQ78_08350 [Mesorhizobium sp.]